MKKTKIAVLASIMSLSMVSLSALANTNGEFFVGASKNDMNYENTSLELDAEAVFVGGKIYFADYYSVDLSYADMSAESDRYSVGINYVRPINERVSYKLGADYTVYEGEFLNDQDKAEYKTLYLGTEVKLNRDVTFGLGLERYDADFEFQDSTEGRVINTDFYADLRYDFDETISFTLYRKEMFQETGFNLIWRF